MFLRSGCTDDQHKTLRTHLSDPRVIVCKNIQDEARWDRPSTDGADLVLLATPHHMPRIQHLIKTDE